MAVVDYMLRIGLSVQQVYTIDLMVWIALVGILIMEVIFIIGLITRCGKWFIGILRSGDYLSAE